MNNAIKRKLTANEINIIVLQALGIEMQDAKELTEGFANTAYSVRLNDGNEVVLKAAPAIGTKMMRYEKNLMRTEVEVLRLVRARGGVPVPEVLMHDDSCTLIDSEFFIMEKLTGKPYSSLKGSLTQQEKDAIDCQLGVYNRLINEIHGEHFGYYAQEYYWRNTWQEAFRLMIMDVLADGKDAGIELPVSYSVIEDEISRHLDALREVGQPSLVHWDLWDGNVFIDSNGEISGIIDFERALWGDPLMEFYFSHFNPSDAFRKGYGLTVETTNQRIRRKLYDLYLDLILWIECDYRQYGDQNHVKWAHENMAKGWERFMAAGAH